MGLIRLLLLIVLVWLVWRVAKQFLLGHDNTPPPANDEHAPGEQKMVRCAQCNVHIPEGLALREQSQAFCCEEHRRQWHE